MYCTVPLFNKHSCVGNHLYFIKMFMLIFNIFSNAQLEVCFQPQTKYRQSVGWDYFVSHKEEIMQDLENAATTSPWMCTL